MRASTLRGTPVGATMGLESMINTLILALAPLLFARKEIIDRTEKYIQQYRITKGGGFLLKNFDPDDTRGLKLEKGEAAGQRNGS